MTATAEAAWNRRAVGVARDLTVCYPRPVAALGHGADRMQSPVHRLLGSLFRLLQMDLNNYGCPSWNPLGEYIAPGMHVLVKPNWVRDYNPHKSGNTDCLYTHPSILRAVLDYLSIALKGRGRVTIGDSPLQSCSLTELLTQSGLQNITRDYSELIGELAIRDFRTTVLEQELHQVGDPAGYTMVHLDADSLHSPRDRLSHRYRVSCIDPAEMLQHHSPGHHEYLIANSFFDADVVINLPKFKTHKKTGLTGALKNLVGIAGLKSCLPHHTQGAPKRDGDEYDRSSTTKAVSSWLADLYYGWNKRPNSVPRRSLGRLLNPLRKWSISASKGGVLDGCWPGNDTLWRTVLDINRIAYYYQRGRGLCDTPQRTILTIVDAIVAGEGDGPLAPGPRPLHLLAGGTNSALVDAVLGKIGGFYIDVLPMISNGFRLKPWPLACCTPDEIDVSCRTGSEAVHMGLRDCPLMPLSPPRYWESCSSMVGVARALLPFTYGAE